MPFALDASIVLAWGLPDEQHPVADVALERLQSDEGMAPALWWFEVRNALIAGERAAIEQDQQALDKLLEGLADMPTPAGPTPREIAARPPFSPCQPYST
jgi:hypothetical protein